MTADPCLSLGEIARLSAADAADPRLAHLRSCPRCRALADELRAFLAADAAGVEPGAIADAETRLAAALEREQAVAAPPAAAAARESFRRSWLAPAWKPALATAAIAAVAVVAVQRPAEEPAPALRGDPVGFALVTAEPAAGGHLVRWRRHEDADGYEVRVHGESLDEVARFATAETSIVLSRDEIAVLPAGPLVVRVAAISHGDEVALSDVAPIER